jgi:hypothetical protein
MYKVLITTAALATTIASDALAQSRDFDWRGRLAPGQTIEIFGINGAIRAMEAAGNEVEVSARIREGRRGDPDDVRIEVVEHSDGVTICAVYPGERRGRSNECRPGGGGQNVRDNDTEVHFTVRVPRGVHFTGRTVNGDLEAESIQGNVRAGTVNGSVHVTAAGWVEARTVNGSIRARMGRADWSGTLEFQTVNGTITVELPDGVGADVTAKTVNGDISTDFPMTVEGRFSSRRISGRIGGGGNRTLMLSTVNGGINLRRGS